MKDLVKRPKFNKKKSRKITKLTLVDSTNLLLTTSD